MKSLIEYKLPEVHGRFWKSHLYPEFVFECLPSRYHRTDRLDTSMPVRIDISAYYLQCTQGTLSSLTPLTPLSTERLSNSRLLGHGHVTGNCREPIALCANVLLDLCCFGAGNGIFARLDFESAVTYVQGTTVFPKSVHTTLKGIAFPAEEVIGVLAVSGSIAKAVHERLFAALEILWIVERRGIPHDLIHDLGNSDGMGAGAG